MEESKHHIQQTVFKLLKTGCSLSDEEFEQFHKYLKKEKNRRYFAEALNDNRSKCELSHEAFESLWRLIKIALIQCELQEDFSTAKNLMHMSATYYRKINDIPEYVQNRVKSIPIWSNSRYWDYSFYDAVACERTKLKQKEWKHMNSTEQMDFITAEQNVFFGQLGSFAFHMLSLGLSIQEACEFIKKQCVVNALPDEYQKMLIVESSFLLLIQAQSNLGTMLQKIQFQEQMLQEKQHLMEISLMKCFKYEEQEVKQKIHNLIEYLQHHEGKVLKLLAERQESRLENIKHQSFLASNTHEITTAKYEFGVKLNLESIIQMIEKEIVVENQHSKALWSIYNLPLFKKGGENSVTEIFRLGGFRWRFTLSFNDELMYLSITSLEDLTKQEIDVEFHLAFLNPIDPQKDQKIYRSVFSNQNISQIAVSFPFLTKKEACSIIIETEILSSKVIHRGF